MLLLLLLLGDRTLSGLREACLFFLLIVATMSSVTRTGSSEYGTKSAILRGGVARVGSGVRGVCSEVGRRDRRGRCCWGGLWVARLDIGDWMFSANFLLEF